MQDRSRSWSGSVVVAAAVIAVAATSTFAGGARKPGAAPPPVAKKVAHTYQAAGRTLSDDYAWLADPGDPDRLAYLEAENAYATQQLAPTQKLADALYKEMLGHVQEDDAEVPVRRGAYLYTAETRKDQPYPVITRRAVDGAGAPTGDAQVVLDLDQLATDNDWAIVRLGVFEPSDDGARVAYTIDATGGLDFALYVKDVATGAIVDGPIAGVRDAAWASDGAHLVFTTDRNSAKRSDRLWCHTVGGRGADRELYAEKDERFDLGVARSKDRAWLVVSAGSHTTSEAWLVPAAHPEARPRAIAGRSDGVEYDVEPRGDALFIRSDHEGPTFGVYRAPIATPDRAHWKAVVPVSADVAITEIDVIRDQLVVLARDHGAPTLRLVGDDGAARAITFDDADAVLGLGQNHELDAPALRVRHESLVTPPETVDVDVATLAKTVLRTQPVPGYDPAKYVAERITVPAADGTAIPVSLVHARTWKADGRAPMLLTGYGAYGFAFDPYFDATRLPLLDRGFAFAIAHVRGGGEAGKPWHDAGRMLQKKNTFTDFIAVADAMVARKYTARARLAITGGSAGGLLIGAVVTMRPDLCKVALPRVPFVDVVNTMLDQSLPLTVPEFEEWGDPRKPDEGAYMLSYSPYDNVAAVAYPAMLIRSGLNDSQVLVTEPAKFVAKLRATATGKAPLVFEINMGAGHAGASNRYDRLRETATDMAWMLGQLGIRR